MASFDDTPPLPDVSRLPRGEAAEAQTRWLGSVSDPAFWTRYRRLGSGARIETLIRIYWSAIDAGWMDLVEEARARLFGSFDKVGVFVPGDLDGPMRHALKPWVGQPDVWEEFRSEIVAKVLMRIEHRTMLVVDNAPVAVRNDYLAVVAAYLQRRTALDEYVASVDPQAAVDGEEDATVVLRLIDMGRMLDRLPELERRAVELHDLEGLKWGSVDAEERTVSSVMGLPVDRVRYLRNVGLQQLKAIASAPRGRDEGDS
jgi:hypothetical protein